MPHLLTATPTSQGGHATHGARTRVRHLYAPLKLIDELCVDAAGSAKLERKQAARRQLHPLLLLRAIWERRLGGRSRGASAGCASERGTFAVVRTSCAPAGCALVPRGTLPPRSLFHFPSGYSPLPRLWNRRNLESCFHTSSCAISICTKMARSSSVHFGHGIRNDVEFNRGRAPVLRRSK